jgi:CDP-glucose 4,6-dehydratase
MVFTYMQFDKQFWKNKRVFLTGHTGFKGSWLSIWLDSLGANVHGYSLKPPTDPSLFNLCSIDRFTNSTIGDIRNRDLLKATLQKAQPEIVFHLAAQPLVRESFKNPVETYETNVMGTVNLLDAVRACPSVKAVVIVTTDKCYENREWHWGYRENDPMGGYDPYSSSKGCAELVTAAYRQSFFNPKDFDNHHIAVASARAGNVIGGGDWALDRLVPDCLKAILDGRKIIVRNPHAIRPWQHVLEPLRGYLLLAQKLFENGPQFAEAWNFGPDDRDCRPVIDVVSKL